MIRALLAFLLALLLPWHQSGADIATVNVPILITHSSGGAVAQTLLPLNPNLNYLFAPNPSFQFTAGTGSHGTALGTLVGAAIFQPSPAFTGTYSLSGTNASQFTINSSTGAISVGGSDLPAGSYALTVVMTQAGVAGSPLSVPITLQGVDVNDTSTLFLAADNYYPTPGSTIHVTVRNDPNASNGGYYDGVGINLLYPRSYGESVSNWEVPPYFVSTGGSGVHNATVSLRVPDPPDTNYQFLQIYLHNANSSVSSSPIVAPLVMVRPTVAYTPPTATNTLSAPFTPSQTITVCRSGCTYSELSLAIIGLSNSNTGNTADNVLITMQAGTYQDCIQWGPSSPFTPPTSDRLWHIPPHLWIKGVGGDFARLEALENPSYTCQGKGVLVYWGDSTHHLWVDNLEIADWTPTGPSGGLYLVNGTGAGGPAGGSVTMRNLLLHDGEMCVITGDSPLGVTAYTLLNVHFTQCGSGQGPGHDIYVGGDGGSFTVTQSILDKPVVGHTLKSRADHSSISCNQLVTNQDVFFMGTLTANFPEGRDATLTNNTLVAGPGGAQQNMVGWADDIEDYDAEFVGGISGSVMTVTQMINYPGASNQLRVGSLINQARGLAITSFGSGTGGVGTYNLNQSLTVAAGTTMYSSVGGTVWGFNFANNWWINDDPGGGSALGDFWGFYIQTYPAQFLMTSPPDPLTSNTWVALPFPYYDYTIGGSNGYPGSPYVTETGSTFYNTRAAAGLPATGAPFPPGCSGTVGNMAIP